MKKIKIIEAQQCWVEYTGILTITDEEFTELENEDISIEDLSLHEIKYDGTSCINEEIECSDGDYEYESIDKEV